MKALGAGPDSAQRTKTEEVLLGMLRENTGTHFLDSGGTYGRHWQQNKEREIEREPPTHLSFGHGYIEVTHRIFHWLRSRLEFDEEANEAFDGPFREEVDPDDTKSWGDLRDEFPAWFARWRSSNDGRSPCDECDGSDGACASCGGIGEVPGDDDLYSATGIYGEGEPLTVNSYNEENLLDQVILFTYFELRSDAGRGGHHGSYVVLQIHGGCDVRGGYSRPKVFEISHDDELAIFDYRRATIYCDGKGEEDHWWTTDDGSHWYREGACGRGAGTQLEAYERKGLTNEDPAWQKGRLWVDEDGKGFCPICGGTLRGSE